jgi:tryptophan synthase alpha chain
VTARLAPVFEACRAENRAALVGYLPACYPSVDSSAGAYLAMLDAGCDLVEIGVPYSDPVMDGPTIQACSEAALRAGARLRDVFAVLEAVAGAGGRAVVMTYYNPVYRHGVEAFARDVASAGGLGVITPDLIPDEAGDWLAAASDHDLDRIFLVAPSSTPARIATTVAACRGFVYAASTMGVTGARDSVSSAAPELVRRVRETGLDVPVGVGLGVRCGAQAAEVARFADAVIVGSAFVTALDAGESALRTLTAELAAGVRGQAAPQPA